MEINKMLAMSCEFAQEHVDNYWPDYSDYHRETRLQCTSFQVSCFLAKFTQEGFKGVEASIVLDELVKRPIKKRDEWLKIIDHLAEVEFGGWLK